MNQTKKMTDGALMVTVYIILLLITLFVPFLSLISLFLLPVPFILFASKYNWKPSIMVLIISIIFTILFATVLSVATPIVMGLGGIMIGSAIYRNLSVYETLARGAFGFIIGLLFLFVFTQVLFQVNIVEELRVGVSESLEMSTSILENVGVEEEAAEFQQIMETQINYLIDLVPVFVIITGLLLALISQWVSYKVLNRVQNEDLYFPPFRTIRIPSSLLWIYLVILLLVLMNFNSSGIFYLAIENAHMLLSILLVIQGFSFIFYYTHHKRLSKIIPIMSIVLTILLPVVFMTLVRIIGIMDIGFKMRERLMSNK